MLRRPRRRRTRRRRTRRRMTIMTKKTNVHQTVKMVGQVVAAVSLNVKEDHTHCVHLSIEMKLIII